MRLRDYNNGLQVDESFFEDGHIELNVVNESGVLMLVGDDMYLPTGCSVFMRFDDINEADKCYVSVLNN